MLQRPGAWRRARLCILLISLCASWWPTLVRALAVDADMKTALFDYQSGQLSKARQEFERAARRGDALGAFNLSSMMMQGQGGPVTAGQVVGKAWAVLVSIPLIRAARRLTPA